MMSNKTYKALMIDPFDQSTSVVDLAVDDYGSVLGSSKAVMDCSTIDIITLILGYDEDGESCSVDNDYVKELTKTTRFLSEDFEGVEPKFEISSWS